MRGIFTAELAGVTYSNQASPFLQALNVMLAWCLTLSCGTTRAVVFSIIQVENACNLVMSQICGGPVSGVCLASATDWPILTRQFRVTFPSLGWCGSPCPGSHFRSSFLYSRRDALKLEPKSRVLPSCTHRPYTAAPTFPGPARH